MSDYGLQLHNLTLMGILCVYFCNVLLSFEYDMLKYKNKLSYYYHYYMILSMRFVTKKWKGRRKKNCTSWGGINQIEELFSSQNISATHIDYHLDYKWSCIFYRYGIYRSIFNDISFISELNVWWQMKLYWANTSQFVSI